MKKIEINNKKYSLPTSLEEITIQQFLIVQEIISSDESNLNKYLQIISYLSSIPENILRDTGTELVNPLLESLDYLFSVDIDSFDSITEFEYLSETYYVNQDFSSSCFGEYIDYDNFLKEHGQLNSIPYLLAVLCKREGESYGDYDAMQRAEHFKNIPCITALSIASFFLSRNNDLILNTLYSSMLQVQVQDKIEDTRNSLHQWVGTGQWFRLQKKMLRRYLVYLERAFQKSFPS
ncbi:hypothetical protein [Catalinimonas alkaloidigena]|uniref:hypothetical protein n=1 Tax=Catalinimonas alkaloidigena TaxID=1075417 RepID=UPI002406E33D|nr:hypothetical protein [Catalinimonas alkaloidigena]